MMLAGEALGDVFQQVDVMLDAEYLPVGARVWFNADRPDLGLWALGHFSEHVHYAREPEVSWARISTTRVRLASSWNATMLSPAAAVLAENSFPLVTKLRARSTVVVDSDRTLGAINARSIALPGSNGRFSSPPFVVQDMRAFSPPSRRGVLDDDYECADATLCGMELLAHGDEDAEFVRHNMRRFALPLVRNDFRLIRTNPAGIDKWFQSKIQHVHAPTLKQRS